MSASTQRWLARAVLVLLAIASAYGLWLIPTGTKHPIALWPVHSDHVVLIVAVACIWVAAALYVIRYAFLFLYELVLLACGR